MRGDSWTPNKASGETPGSIPLGTPKRDGTEKLLKILGEALEAFVEETPVEILGGILEKVSKDLLKNARRPVENILSGVYEGIRRGTPAATWEDISEGIVIGI